MGMTKEFELALNDVCILMHQQNKIFWVGMEVMRVNRIYKKCAEKKMVPNSGMFKRQWENQYAWREGFWLSENQCGKADYKDPCIWGCALWRLKYALIASRGEQTENLASAF